MYNQKQLVRFGLYAERAYRLAFDMAMAAAELGSYGRGIAVVADETRNIGKKLYTLLDHEQIEETEVFAGIMHLKYLAVNGCVEMLRLSDSPLGLRKKLAVILDEVRNLTDDLGPLFGIHPTLPLVLPLVTSKSKVIGDAALFHSCVRFALFSIGGIPFCEMVNHVMEVFFCENPDIQGNSLSIRGCKLPLLNLYPVLSKKPTGNGAILQIRTEYETEPKEFAVWVDDVPEIFFSGLGMPAKPVGVPPALVRECWDCEEGQQMVFIDYNCAEEFSCSLTND